MSNAAGGNAVLLFNRAADGALSNAGNVSTGGAGQGSELGSQGALVLSQDHRWLLAANAGSNDVTVFSVTDDGLQFRSKTPSGGTAPVSIAIRDHLVYVLNAGTTNVTGFLDTGCLTVSELQGDLSPGIRGSMFRQRLLITYFTPNQPKAPTSISSLL